jgi:DNA polymerase bacteriophage-type
MPILVDFESVSRCDLKTYGGRRYWEHPSTQALCAVLYDTDSGHVEVWQRGDPIPRFDHADALGAHNAVGFDRFAAEREWGVPAHAHPWIDTSELARTAGLPGALDALGTRWLGIPKDKVASKFTRSLSTCRRPSGKGPDAIPPDVWKALSPTEKRERGVQKATDAEVMTRVIAYCASDVEILAHGWPALESWQTLEPDVSAAERAVNDRGVRFDVDLARALLDADARNAERSIADVARELGWTSERVRAAASSPAQFTEITGAPNAQKDTVAEIDHPLARARQALASIARGKLEAGLARVSRDGRLRDSHKYYGAHTGRWSGRGMQLQNVPRPEDRFEKWGDAEICRAVDAAKAGADVDAGLLDVLLRATITAKPGHTLVVEDFSGVEARALAWVADDRGALEVFASKRDPYKVMASTIFGIPYESIGKDDKRDIGKKAELACGYGMGANKFAERAAAAGSDLDALGVDPQEVVDAWRKLHAPIVRFWRACDDAFRGAVRGVESSVDQFTFTPSDDGRDVAIFLPSGRPIVYNGASMVQNGGRTGLAYHGTKGIEHIYGGKIVENVIQAMCRDLLADAMVRCERAGLPVVLHVHDELVCEVPAQAAAEGAALLHAIMVDLPEWAEGFPVGAAGHHGTRYRK